MKPLGLAPYYIQWHYSQALRNIIAVARNLIWFFWHFFSIGLLLSTLFLPWQKIQDDAPTHTLDMGAILTTLLINTLMRIAGAVIRLFMIAIGIAMILGTIAGAFVFFIFWLALPVCIIAAFLIGVVIMIKPA